MSIEEELEKIDHAINGNARDGLKQIVDNLKSDLRAFMERQAGKADERAQREKEDSISQRKYNLVVAVLGLIFTAAMVVIAIITVVNAKHAGVISQGHSPQEMAQQIGER